MRNYWDLFSNFRFLWVTTIEHKDMHFLCVSSLARLQFMYIKVVSLMCMQTDSFTPTENTPLGEWTLPWVMQKTTTANENLSDSGANVHITLSCVCRPLPPSILEVIAICCWMKWAAPFIKLWFSLGFSVVGNIWNNAILEHNSTKCIHFFFS